MESQRRLDGLVPGPEVPQPVSVTCHGQKAHKSPVPEGYITREMEYQVTRHWA